jgi:hypothetical protein
VVDSAVFTPRARSRAPPAQVTLVDRHNYHLFQPLLYQVATASLSPGDVASPIRSILRRQKNVDVLLGDASEIDPAGRRVLIGPSPAEQGGYAGTTIPYDYLIVATGAAHAYFGHPEWAERAPGLKTLDDALEMRRRLLLAFEAAERETDPERQRRLLTFVIVGGGPTASSSPVRWRRSLGCRCATTSGASGPSRRASCWSRGARTCWRRLPTRCASLRARRWSGSASRCAPMRSLSGSTRRASPAACAQRCRRRLRRRTA